MSVRSVRRLVCDLFTPFIDPILLFEQLYKSGDLPHVGDCRFFERHGIAVSRLERWSFMNGTITSWCRQFSTDVSRYCLDQLVPTFVHLN